MHEAVMTKIRAKSIEADGPLDSKCLIWMGASTRDGYGRIRVPNPSRAMRVHRVVWEASHGPIPSGLMVCHTCDVPACCNIDHLFLGTGHDNVRDRTAKGRAASGPRNGTHTRPDRRPTGLRNGKHTHPESRPFGVRNGAARHCPETVARAIECYSRCGSYTSVANGFGVCRNTVKNWVLGTYRQDAVACRLAERESR